MRIVTCAAITALLVTAVPVLAKDQPVISLPRMSKWEMNYDVDSCHLAARFGSGEQNVILRITRDEPGDWFDLQLYSKMLASNEITVPIEVTFGAQGKLVRRTALSLTMSGPEKTPVLRMSASRVDGWEYQQPGTAPVITPGSEAAVTEITFKPRGGKRYRLETGSLGAPLAAMRKCTADMVTSWGYDPAVQAQLSSRPMPVKSPATWLHSGDFPVKALLAGHNGLIRFRLDVDELGHPVGCTVLYRTNPDEFADLSCKLLLKRAQFTAALDAQGKPVKSFYINSIRWVAGDW